MSEDKNKDFMTCSDQAKANEFAKFFSSVQTKEPDDTWAPLNRPDIKEQLVLEITEESLMKRLCKLKTSKSPGPDSIHPRVVFEVRHAIVKPLLYIFKTSVKTSTIPAPWKDANITAIFKKGDKHVSGNYRPVSLTSIACKILESFIVAILILPPIIT